MTSMEQLVAAASTWITNSNTVVAAVQKDLINDTYIAFDIEI